MGPARCSCPGCGRWWAKTLAVLYPIVTISVVVITANHYLLDAVGGAVIFLVGYVAARLVTRAGRGPPGRRRGPDPGTRAPGPSPGGSTRPVARRRSQPAAGGDGPGDAVGRHVACRRPRASRPARARSRLWAAIGWRSSGSRTRRSELVDHVAVALGEQALLAVARRTRGCRCGPWPRPGRPAQRASRAAMPNDSRLAGATKTSARANCSRISSRVRRPTSCDHVAEVVARDVLLERGPLGALADDDELAA